MDSFPRSGPNTAAPTAPTGRTLATAPFNNEAEFDHTIKVKTPASGSMFFNRYRLDRVLGRGGMGVVWLADDLKLERPVALKFLPSLLGLDSAAVKELKTETRRGLELSHPNIVRIYDFVDDEELAAISMEFVDGKTLSELRMTTEHGVFSVPQVMQWLPGVIAALDYAHFHRKLVHRDLKPANIMATTKDNVAKVADFGIARSLSDTMSRLSAAHLGTSGTLPYMSPQQAMGERPMPTDDVYSLGATIYELLSGKPPFYRGDISTQITSKVPSSMLERREELDIRAADSIPKEWETAIAMCLRKDPGQRPQSAGALAEMLGLPNSLTSGVTKTFVAQAAPAAANTAPKSKLPLYAAAAAVVLGGGAAAYYFARPAAPGLAARSSPASATAATPASESNSPAKAAAQTAPVVTPVTGPASPPVENVQANAEARAAATGGTPPPSPAVASAPAATAPPRPAASETPASAAASSPMAVPAPPPSAPGSTTSTPATVAAVGPGASGPAAPNGMPYPPMSTAEPGTTPDVPPAVIAANLPPVPGTTPPPAPAMVQPPVTEPPNGHWPLAMLFPTPPQASYSENGRRHLLYEAQSLLREKDLYNSTQDGKEGKGTHNAIVLFQAKNGLVPNGLLDGPTLAAMELADIPDEAAWKAPAVASSSSSRRRSAKPKEEPNFLQRAGKSIGKLFKRD